MEFKQMLGETLGSELPPKMTTEDRLEKRDKKGLLEEARAFLYNLRKFSMPELEEDRTQLKELMDLAATGHRESM